MHPEIPKTQKLYLRACRIWVTKEVWLVAGQGYCFIHGTEYDEEYVCILEWLERTIPPTEIYNLNSYASISFCKILQLPMKVTHFSLKLFLGNTFFFLITINWISWHFSNLMFHWYEVFILPHYKFLLLILVVFHGFFSIS